MQDALAFGAVVVAQVGVASVEYGVEVRPLVDVAALPHHAVIQVDLHVVIGALQQWGDEHIPRVEGPSVVRRSGTTDQPVRVAFIDSVGRLVPEGDVVVVTAPPASESAFQAG